MIKLTDNYETSPDSTSASSGTRRVELELVRVHLTFVGLVV